jgi:hypothetical protein
MTTYMKICISLKAAFFHLVGCSVHLVQGVYGTFGQLRQIHDSNHESLHLSSRSHNVLSRLAPRRNSCAVIGPTAVTIPLALAAPEIPTEFPDQFEDFIGMEKCGFEYVA